MFHSMARHMQVSERESIFSIDTIHEEVGHSRESLSTSTGYVLLSNSSHSVSHFAMESFPRMEGNLVLWGSFLHASSVQAVGGRQA